jgi:L-lactate dehydrogenase complex protein LldG
MAKKRPSTDDIAAELDERVRQAVRERDRWEAMRRAFETNEAAKVRNAPRMKGLKEREMRLQDVRKRTLMDPALIDEAVRNLESGGIRVRRARDAGEAVALVLEEVGRERLLVKSKSNVSKEVHLTERLEAAGIEVVETDLGDRILQIGGISGVHPTGPAAHLDRNDIAKVLTKYAGRPIPPDPRAEMDFVLADLSSAIERARIGLTGANAIGAEEGALLLLHNEGNIAKVMMRPDKHIVITSLDKVYPNLDEALNAARLQTYYGTGSVVTSYINVIGGVSKTADIEKKIFTGLHGPKEVVVVLVDNGRSTAPAELLEVYKCIGCGDCLTHCPVYDAVGSLYGEGAMLGGRGVGAVAATEGLDAAIRAGLYFCTGCTLCESACPASVDTPGVLTTLRRRALREGKAIPAARAILDVVREKGSPYGEALERLPAPGRAPTVLFVGCADRRPEGDSDVPAARRVLARLGVEHTFIDERCCQAVVELLGGERDRKMVKHNVDAIKRAGAKRVVCLCPTCAHTLAPDLDGTGIEVLPLVELLAGAELPARFEGRVTYHDPCDLGRKSRRGASGFDAPRAAIRATGAELVELQHSHGESRCCGGGGLLATYPTLSVALAKERMDEVRATGAEWCLADCPNCVHNLRSALKGKDRVQVATTLRWLDSLLSQ